MTLTLRLEGVDKRYGGLHAVRDVSMTIAPGTITGLIGPNGAGKSTLFNLVTRVVDVSDGRIFLDDRDVTRLSAARVAALGVARTFQTPRGFASLSVVENVEAMLSDPREGLLRAVFSRGSGAEARDQAVAALETVGLAHRSDAAYGDLSAGEHRLLEIARQLVREPKALLLDEPTAGVHPDLQGQLRDLLLRCRDRGMLVLVVEHNLGFLMSIASSVNVLTDGALIASATPDEIAKDPAVRDAYLGRTTEDAPPSA